MNWLDCLTAATIELEPPERYFWWAGVAAISAIVRKNVWIDRFSYTLYPNVYVILVSAKSALRKGLPVDYAKWFVERLECTRVVSGRNSVQGVLKELSTQRTLENGTVLSDAQAFLCAPEFASFMVKDPEGLTILTDLHNTHEHHKAWTNTLKSSPVESLKNPCITLLAASNEALFEDLISSKDIEGGFIGRSFIVHESQRRVINSLMYKPEFLIPKEDLLQPLKEIMNAKGPFTISPIVREYYSEWYKELAENTSPDRSGTLDRLGDQVLKLAMIVSLARCPDLEITMTDMVTAIERTEFSFSGVKKVTMGGTSDLAPALMKALKILLDAPEYTIERQKILQRLKFDVDSMTLDRIVDTLGETSGSGAVKMFRGLDKKIYLRLNEFAVAEYKKFEGR